MKKSYGPGLTLGWHQSESLCRHIDNNTPLILHVSWAYKLAIWYQKAKCTCDQGALETAAIQGRFEVTFPQVVWCSWYRKIKKTQRCPSVLLRFQFILTHCKWSKWLVAKFFVAQLIQKHLAPMVSSSLLSPFISSLLSPLFFLSFCPCWSSNPFLSSFSSFVVFGTWQIVEIWSALAPSLISVKQKTKLEAIRFFLLG